MFASYSPGLDRRSASCTADDIDAVCEIYPSTTTAACNAEPSNGYSERCDGAEPAGLCSTQPAGGVSYLYLQNLGFRWIEAFVVGTLVVIALCFGVQVALADPDWRQVILGFARSRLSATRRCSTSPWASSALR